MFNSYVHLLPQQSINLARGEKNHTSHFCVASKRLMQATAANCHNIKAETNTQILNQGAHGTTTALLLS